MDRLEKWKWTFASGAITLFLGLVLAVFPVVDREVFVVTAGWILLVSGLVELAADLVGRKSPEASGLLFLALITVGAGILLILNPILKFVTMLQLVILSLSARGVAATIAAFRAEDEKSPWLLTRAAADIVLAVILLMGAHIAALALLIFGSDWSWAGAETLGSFLGISFVAAGFCSTALAVVQRRGAAGRPD